MHPTSIYGWLQNVQQDATPPALKRDRCDCVADAAAMSSSPTKRVRPSTPESLEVQAAAPGPSDREEQTTAEQEETPTRLSYRLPGQSIAREVLVPRPLWRGRSRSPEKNKVQTVPDLVRLLAVPVRYQYRLETPGFFATSAAAEADKGIPGLYRRLLLVENSQGILPSGLRSRIEALVSPNSILPFMWSTTTQTHPISTNTSGETSDALLKGVVELEGIKKIIAATCKSFETRAAEVAWNSSVHEVVLGLALDTTPSVGCYNVTRAPMAGPFRPKLANSSASDVASLVTSSSASSLSSAQTDAGPQAGPGDSFHKMVDFALCLEPGTEQGGGGGGGGTGAGVGTGASLTALVNAFLAAQPDGEQWINAMSYEPMRNRPAAVFVESKSSVGKLEDARVQLGICLAGWHSRMRRILDRTKRTGAGACVIAAPVIFVVEADWEVVFVVDGRGLAVPTDEIVRLPSCSKPLICSC